jgi:hypothetical protein
MTTEEHRPTLITDPDIEKVLKEDREGNINRICAEQETKCFRFQNSTV